MAGAGSLITIFNGLLAMNGRAIHIARYNAHLTAELTAAKFTVLPTEESDLDPEILTSSIKEYLGEPSNHSKDDKGPTPPDA